MNDASPIRLASRAIVAAALGLLGPGRASGDELPAGVPTNPKFRQPVALAFDPDGAWLYAANRRSGSLSIIDVAGARVVAEHDVGRGLAGLVGLPGGRLLAVDEAASALLLLEARGRSVRVVERLEVGRDPVGVLATADGAWCVVASRWSRRLTVVDVARGDDRPALRVARTLELPFRPRDLAWVRDGSRLVVADAFGGRLAVADPREGVLVSVRALPAHNIRGLALSPDGRTLLVAHQRLSPLATSSFEDVHWGSMIGNQLRALRVDALLGPGTDADLLRGSRLIDLGDVGRAAGDPAGLAYDRSGNYVVALAGVDEVAIGPGLGDPVHRLAVGRRPTAVVFAPDGTTAYVADTLDDTVSVVAAGAGVKLRTISLGPRPEPGPADLGERLFSDARLSHDGWMSCQSCHTDGHSNGLRNDTLGDGSYGAPKRVPSLLGVGATGPWTWIGGVARLEDQVRKSIETTMRGASPTAEQVEALTAFLRSLAPPPMPAGDPAAAERGREVFRSRKCADCHAPPEYTTPERYDVGLVDEVGNREFNPPSLRGVGLREPLLHDGRARTLEEVFLEHRHPRDSRFSPDEGADLAAFLRTL